MEFLVGVVSILVAGALLGGLVALPFLLLAWLVRPRPRPPARLAPRAATSWTVDDEIVARHHH